MKSGRISKNTSMAEADIRRLANLYREIHADACGLLKSDERLTVSEFEAMAKDVASRMGVSPDRVGELIAESHES
jgi:hypothetical protein